MSNQSDNPLARFAAFWWGLGVFSLFGILLLALRLFTGGGDDANPLEEAAAADRLEIRAEVDAAQDAAFGYKVLEEGKTVQVPPHEVFGLIGDKLIGSKPVAVKKPEQMVPGGEAQLAAAEGPSADFAAVDAQTPPADAEIDPAVMEAGKAAFMVCMACHGMNGEGGPIGPKLAGSDWVTGPVSNLIRIQLRGLEGPIHINGELYTPLTPMAPLATQSNEQIAAVLTYIRNSFGNKASPVLPEQVEMLRSEVGKPALKEADLIKP